MESRGNHAWMLNLFALGSAVSGCIEVTSRKSAATSEMGEEKPEKAGEKLQTSTATQTSSIKEMASNQVIATTSLSTPQPRRDEVENLKEKFGMFMTTKARNNSDGDMEQYLKYVTEIADGMRCVYRGLKCELFTPKDIIKGEVKLSSLEERRKESDTEMDIFLTENGARAGLGPLGLMLSSLEQEEGGGKLDGMDVGREMDTELEKTLTENNKIEIGKVGKRVKLL